MCDVDLPAFLAELSSKSHSNVTASPFGSCASAEKSTSSGLPCGLGRNAVVTTGARLPTAGATVIVTVLLAVAPLPSVTVTRAVNVPGAL